MSRSRSAGRDGERWSEEFFEAAALRYLARYESTAEHLRGVLRGRVAKARLEGEDLDADALRERIDRVVDRARAEGWVDDERYARARFEALRRRGDSGRVIRRKLEAKGVPPELVEALFRAEAARGDDDAELEAARRLVRRRRLGPARRREARPGDESRDLAALARAGFSIDVARRALEKT